MSVETATTIAALNAALPSDTDSLGEGSQHIRLIKTILKSTFGSAAVVAADMAAIAGKGSLLTSLLGGLLSVSSAVLKVTGGLLVTGATTLQGLLSGSSATFSGALNANTASVTGVMAAGALQGGTLTTGGGATIGGLLNVSPNGIVTGGTVSGANVTAATGSVSAQYDVTAGRNVTGVNAVLGAVIYQGGTPLLPPLELIWHTIGVPVPGGYQVCDGSNGTPDYYSNNPLVASLGICVLRRIN